MDFINGPGQRRCPGPVDKSRSARYNLFDRAPDKERADL